MRSNLAMIFHGFFEVVSVAATVSFFVVCCLGFMGVFG